jgi:hypothetical protein
MKRAASLLLASCAPLVCVAGDGPAGYAAFIREEVVKWAKVAKAAGIQPE